MFNIRSEIWRQSVTVSVFCFHFFNAFLRSCDLSLTVPILLRRLILFFLMLPFDPLKTLIQSEIVSGAPKGNAGRERVKSRLFCLFFVVLLYPEEAFIKFSRYWKVTWKLLISVFFAVGILFEAQKTNWFI